MRSPRSTLTVKIPTELDDLFAQPMTGMRVWCDEVERGSSTSLLQWLETSRSKNISPLHILIGPEGGWSVNERELLGRESLQTCVRKPGPTGLAC